MIKTPRITIYDIIIVVGSEKLVAPLKKYITVEQIMLFLNLCETCQKKANLKKMGLVIRPMISDEMNSKA